MSCLCRCHVGGPHTSCDLGPVQPGGLRSCIVIHTESDNDANNIQANVTPEIPLDERCVLGHTEPVERYIGLLCKRHYHWVYNTLDEISTLYAALPLVMLPGPSSSDRHGTSVEAPAPGRLDVMAITELRDDLRSTRDPGDELWYEGCADIPKLIPALQSWISTMFEDRGNNAPTKVALYRGERIGDWYWRHGRWQLPDDLAGCVRILRREQRWISAQLWVDDYTNELGRLHRALATAVGDTMWPKPIGKCPNDGTSMFNTIGVDAVTCRKCGKTWEGVHLARLRLIHEQEAQREAQRA